MPDIDDDAKCRRALAPFGEQVAETLTSGDQFELAYKVSDRSLSHDGLYLQGVNHLLELVRSRCTRSEVLSFLAEPTVQRARRISDDGAELFAEWTRAAGIRWGLDASHRERWSRSSKHVAHPRHDVANEERLRQVVVRSNLHGELAIGPIGSRRQHNDRKIERSMAPDVPA